MAVKLSRTTNERQRVWLTLNVNVSWRWLINVRLFTRRNTIIVDASLIDLWVNTSNALNATPSFSRYTRNFPLSPCTHGTRVTLYDTQYIAYIRRLVAEITRVARHVLKVWQYCVVNVTEFNIKYMKLVTLVAADEAGTWSKSVTVMRESIAITAAGNAQSDTVPWYMLSLNVGELSLISCTVTVTSTCDDGNTPLALATVSSACVTHTGHETVRQTSSQQ